MTTVEAYLDRLFDLLSGSGARGRRVLLEAQAHLEEAVEQGFRAKPRNTPPSRGLAPPRWWRARMWRRALFRSRRHWAVCSPRPGC